MVHDVDKRLLFFPFFERLWRGNNPKTASLLTNEEARSAFLRAIEASGNAQRGHVRRWLRPACSGCCEKVA